MKNYAIRLSPGEKLKSWIEFFARKENIKAGAILTCVGSLSQVKIRLAGGKEFREFEEKLEITSLVGTLSQEGLHIHITISDSKGNVYGGHLVEGIINTTAEIVLSSFDNFEFKREDDPKTGFKELFVRHNI